MDVVQVISLAIQVVQVVPDVPRLATFYWHAVRKLHELVLAGGMSEGTSAKTRG